MHEGPKNLRAVSLLVSYYDSIWLHLSVVNVGFHYEHTF